MHYILICDIIESYLVGPVLYVEIKIKGIKRHKIVLFSKKKKSFKEFEILSLKFGYADRMFCCVIQMNFIKLSKTNFKNSYSWAAEKIKKTLMQNEHFFFINIEKL